MFLDPYREYYHLTANKLNEGSTIIRGNYGRVVKSMGWNHKCAMRERLLEEARIRVNPSAPSRLSCAFCFPSLDNAIAFKMEENGFQWHLAYQVKLVNFDGHPFLCNHRHVSPSAFNDGEWPDKYWMRKGTETEQNFPYPEVLVLGDLLIDRIIDDTAYNL